MKKIKLGLVNICLVLLLLSGFWLLPSTCLAAEPMYQITETELTALENNLSSLAQINKSSLARSVMLQQQLDVSLDKQQQLEQSCYKLESKLLTLTEKSKNQEELLAKARQSLKPSAPAVLREVGIKIDVDDYARGVSYGVSRRIGNKYIGIRGEYDWKDAEAGVWVTYAY